jgi:hypothetical protein
VGDDVAASAGAAAPTSRDAAQTSAIRQCRDERCDITWKNA